MRVRRDSGTKLDYYNKIVNKSILIHQVGVYFNIKIWKTKLFFIKNPVTGLLSSNETDHAWVRDNVYSIMSGN